MVVHELVVEADGLEGPLALAGRGSVEGAGDIEVEAQTGSLMALISPSGPIPIELRARIFEGGIDAEGSFGTEGSLRAVDLRFAAEIAHLRRVGRRFGFELPQLGGVSRCHVGSCLRNHVSVRRQCTRHHAI